MTFTVLNASFNTVMIELVLFFIIVTLIGVSAYKEKLLYEHIKELEGKLAKTNPQVYWAEKNEGKKPVPNQMAEESNGEVPLSEIPMMEFTDRDFKIQLEGDSETPAEARAMKEK